MTLKFSAFSIMLTFLFLSDPSSTSCGGCDTFIRRTGILPDTTLSKNVVWKINVKEELFSLSSDCDEGFTYYSPKVSYELEKQIITIFQNGDTLYINPIQTGSTSLFLSASTSQSIDPDIINQHLTISVQ